MYLDAESKVPYRILIYFIKATYIFSKFLSASQNFQHNRKHNIQLKQFKFDQ